MASEAETGLDLLRDFERSLLTALAALDKCRRGGRAARAIDLLAAAPIISAKTLATHLGMAVTKAMALLDEFQTAGTRAGEGGGCS